MKPKFKRLDYRMSFKDWVLHLTATPLLIILSDYFMWGPVYFSKASIFVSVTLLTCILGLLLSVANMRSMNFVRRRFPALNQTGYRLGFSLLFYAVCNVAGGFLLLWVFTLLPFAEYTITAQKAVNAVVILLVAACIAGLGYEFFYASEKWKEGVRENEALQRLQLHTELNVLKSQVNPHFLFNSLNSLSYLISEDAEKAEAYLAELTRVYRYLLRNNTVELTDLATELQFIKSYHAMLHTSHGSGIELLVNAPDQNLACLMPPLTLQLLVENAVKHNVVHKTRPLCIEIACPAPDRLTVSNNLQKKTGYVASNKVGLGNIAAKYRLLKQPEISVAQTDTHFSVTLPLIAPPHGFIQNAALAKAGVQPA